MYFQIEKLILWARKINYTYKIIEFSKEKINVITGASRTGKSAIIPIIDYCLGEHECRIPVNTIRNACSWFGVIINIGSKKLLLARREPESQKTTDDMMILEGEEISLPDCPRKNTTRKNVCRYLDETAKITFLKLVEDTNNQFNERPSFRDMMAFCYQPQNIVANANTMFYKADTMDHRSKLINIFPYILGAVTPEVLSKRQEISDLQRQLKRKEKELDKLLQVASKWKIEIGGWINAAKEYGLLEKEVSTEGLGYQQQVDLLKRLSQKKYDDSEVISENIEEASQEIVSLRNKENELSLELSKYKSRYIEMTQFVNSIEEYRKTLSIQIERLNVSKWMKELTEKNQICPFCGSQHNVSNQMENLIENLEELEKEADGVSQIPAAFEREYKVVEEEIENLAEEITAVQKRIKILNNVKDGAYGYKYTLESVSRFLGKMQYAEETYRSIGQDGELQSSIVNIKNRLAILEEEVNEAKIAKKIRAALKNIELKVMKLLPHLDIERPEDIVEIDYKNLTLSITGLSGRRDYLWEIGSGSNWLAYHIAVSLAFQVFFSEQNSSPVPQFLIYDQPSQVYFPKKLAGKQMEEEDPELNDEDIIAVQKIFNTMSIALNSTKTKMQIIVLEHADESAWEGIDNVHLVAEWRGENNKLVPEEWIERTDNLT